MTVPLLPAEKSRYVGVRGEMLAFFAIAAVCLVPPVEGPLVAGYSPSGQYQGHWGVDYVTPYEAIVLAPASGVVTFAGSVAGMRSVTIEAVPGFKISVSYLSDIGVQQGSWVRRGEQIGTAGLPHSRPGVHMSTRIDGRYVDPERQIGCRSTDVSRALRLITPPRPYPRSRAHRHSRRDFRPDTPGSPPCRASRPSSGTTGPPALHAGGGPLAEVRSERDGVGTTA